MDPTHAGRATLGTAGHQDNDYYLIAGVWVGFDSERSLGSHETGGVAACPIWTAFMKEALADTPVVDFPVPKGVSVVQIDPATGLRAVPGGAAELEYFVAGTEPNESADVQQVSTDDENGTGTSGTVVVPAPSGEVSTGDD
jgi:penicillin-binding protein 1A